MISTDGIHSVLDHVLLCANFDNRDFFHKVVRLLQILLVMHESQIWIISDKHLTGERLWRFLFLCINRSVSICRKWFYFCRVIRNGTLDAYYLILCVEVVTWFLHGDECIGWSLSLCWYTDILNRFSVQVISTTRTARWFLVSFPIVNGVHVVQQYLYCYLVSTYNISSILLALVVLFLAVPFSQDIPCICSLSLAITTNP